MHMRLQTESWLCILGVSQAITLQSQTAPIKAKPTALWTSPRARLRIRLSHRRSQFSVASEAHTHTWTRTWPLSNLWRELIQIMRVYVLARVRLQSVMLYLTSALKAKTWSLPRVHYVRSSLRLECKSRSISALTAR